MKEINGNDAIVKMRAISKQSSFNIIFFTFDRAKNRGGGQLKKHENCRVRHAMLEEMSNVDIDHYLFFSDSEGNPRTCWKKLIRYVAFPPEYNYEKINWLK